MEGVSMNLGVAMHRMPSKSHSHNCLSKKLVMNLLSLPYSFHCICTSNDHIWQEKTPLLASDDCIAVKTHDSDHGDYKHQVLNQFFITTNSLLQQWISLTLKAIWRKTVCSYWKIAMKSIVKDLGFYWGHQEFAFFRACFCIQLIQYCKLY